MTPNIDKDCTHIFKENKLKKEIEEIIKELELRNPYPIDVFPKLELNSHQTLAINDFLVMNFKISLDRLSAELMRRARVNLIEELKSKINGENKK